MVALFLFGAAGACSGEEGDRDVSGDADAGADEPGETDAGGDAGEGTDAQDDGGGIPNPWGFDLRYPTDDRLSCINPAEPHAVWPDADWICSFSYGGVEAVIYVQATPVRCDDYALPVFETRGAQIYVDGAVSPLTSAAYDWGGNHHNDRLEFSWGGRLAGRRYVAFHSSLGFGWRACHPMDCLRVFDEAGALIEDGCTCDRTVPAVCVQVRSDGTWDDLVDTFEVCPGDRTCGA